MQHHEMKITVHYGRQTLKWNDNAIARELKAVEEIKAAQKYGELNIIETNIIVNNPSIKWQDGSLQLK
jgi:hypothetical protein